MNYDLRHRDHIERIIIGSVLIETSVIKRFIQHDIRISDFKNTINKDIVKAILETNRKGQPIDLVTVYHSRPQKYRSNSAIEFEQAMIEYTQLVSSTVHFDNHCLLLKQYILMDYWNKRAEEIMNSNWENRDVIKVSENINKGYEKLMKRFTGGLEKIDGEDDVESLKRTVENRQKGISTGVSIGVSEFDVWCDGFQAREYITIAGRPGMGKTTFVLAMLVRFIESGTPAVFFTLEMSKLDIKQRLATALTGIPFKNIKTGKLTAEEFTQVVEAYKKIDNSSVTIYGGKGTKVYEDVVEKIKECEGRKIAIIDYIQLMKLRQRIDKRLEIAEITSGLKLLANELDIPIIGLAQLSRSVETRGGSKIPKLSDLKESGSFEEDSDTVGFLYREAYYQEQQNAGLELPMKEKGKLKLIIAKGRNTGTKQFEIFLDLANISMCSYSDLQTL